MDTFRIEQRRYLGAKSRMLDFIKQTIDENTTDVNVFADTFGGTGVVASMFRDAGKDIIINDLLDSNFLVYEAFLSNDDFNREKVKASLDKMNNLPLADNYVSVNYGGRYFSMENAQKIGEVRQFIDSQTGLTERERAILLTSLLYGMDRVANTVGHYDAYRQKMDSFTPIQFQYPDIKVNGADSELYHEDANELVKHIKADVVYIDPPYNSRQYGDVYHVLENVMEWEKPELFGVAKKPKDRSKTKSNYSTSKAPDAFEDLIKNIDARYIVVSYSNMAQKGAGRSNAKISNEEIIERLSLRGKVQIFELPFQAFTTGKTKVQDHKELLYLVEVTK